jgi:hypothetical protein
MPVPGATGGGVGAELVPTGGAGGMLRRETSVTTPEQGGGSDNGSGAIRESLSSREWDELVDEVVRRIEHRVADELARRGRRFTPPVM